MGLFEELCRDEQRHTGCTERDKKKERIIIPGPNSSVISDLLGVCAVIETRPELEKKLMNLTCSISEMLI